MKFCLRKLITTEIGFLFCLFTSGSAIAQITPDTTLPKDSLVIEQGNTSIIEGGTTKGSNLFHSFEQFSIPTGSAAYFNNTLDIQNIISRVTGGSVSNIDGLLRSNGTANFFLLNPNGIIFGNNATLNVGGSFLATTASSLNFADGTQLSTTTNQKAPLLTISVPNGLQFSSNSGGIRIQDSGHNLVIPFFSSPVIEAGASPNGLQVLPEKTLAFIGNGVDLEGGILTAPGGRIELGSVSSGVVDLIPTSTNWALGFKNIQNFQDIALSKQALVDTSGSGVSSIQLAGKQISFTQGAVALIQNQGSQASNGINLQSSDSIQLSGVSRDGTIPSGIQVQTLGGTVGDIIVSTKHLQLGNGAAVASKTFTQAGSSNIVLNASESIKIKGFSLANANNSASSGIGSFTFSDGGSGNIIVKTGELTVLDGGNIISATFSQGRSGDVNINAERSIEVHGFNPFLFLPSQISVTAFDAGDTGNITIISPQLFLRNGGAINSSTFSSGNAGNITISVNDSITLDTATNLLKENPLGFYSNIGAFAVIPPLAIQRILSPFSNLTGDSGEIVINTRQLLASNSSITVNNFGTGLAKDLNINANSISLQNNSSITASSVLGNGGNIFLNLKRLELSNSAVSANVDSSQANLLFIGVNSPFNFDLAGVGNGGNIQISADLLIANQNSRITANALMGKGGNITINTGALAALANSDISANAPAGAGGRIEVNAQGIFGIEPRNELTPKSDITASSGVGIDGEIEINSLDFDTRNSLTPLQSNFVTTEQVVAGSCLARRNAQQGSFVVTGSGGLPINPYSGITEWETLTGVQLETSSNISTSRSQPTSFQLHPDDTEEDYATNWKPGDPIAEAQGIVKTADGRTLLGTKPQDVAIADAQALVCSAEASSDS